jgi:hypothetical protein
LNRCRQPHITFFTRAIMLFLVLVSALAAAILSENRI